MMVSHFPLADGATVEESLIIGGGWPDGGSFHMIEFTQTLLERRKGGETGIAWVEAMKVSTSFVSRASQ